jgi:RNA polymerase sigma-70 factor (ECF subfamily)
MTAAAESSADAALVRAALTGDEDAFRALVEPYRRELHVHCYRLLGSVHDAEDALQETLLRAWRHLGTYGARSPFRAWLYRIATNVCLRAAERRPPAAATTAEEAAELAVTAYPDSWLEELAARELPPAARYELFETVQLAFLVAIQLLPPRQRAVLVLRDVLGWSARETAELLDTSTASVNSALQRARVTLEERRAAGRLARSAGPVSDEQERSLLRRYVDAWRRVDIDGLVSLLREDAVMTMPPVPMLVAGRRAIGEFFATVPAGGELQRIHLLPTRANRQPALAAYVQDEADCPPRAYGLMVLTVDGDAIAGITGFVDPALFALFGLPERL